MQCLLTLMSQSARGSPQAITDMHEIVLQFGIPSLIEQNGLGRTLGSFSRTCDLEPGYHSVSTCHFAVSVDTAMDDLHQGLQECTGWLLASRGFPRTRRSVALYFKIQVAARGLRRFVGWTSRSSLWWDKQNRDGIPLNDIVFTKAYSLITLCTHLIHMIARREGWSFLLRSKAVSLLIDCHEHLQDLQRKHLGMRLDQESQRSGTRTKASLESPNVSEFDGPFHHEQTPGLSGDQEMDTLPLSDCEGVVGLNPRSNLLNRIQKLQVTRQAFKTKVYEDASSTEVWDMGMSLLNRAGRLQSSRAAIEAELAMRCLSESWRRTRSCDILLPKIEEGID